MNNFLGIDIGGTNINFGVIREEGEIIFTQTVSTANFQSVEDLATHIEQAIKKETKEDFIAIGIGAPSVNSETQEIQCAPNLNWGEIIPIKSIFEKIFNKSVFVMNDANAAAMGEKIFGEAGDLKHFAVVTLGTGVGLGSFINGQIMNGTNGLAGELGHMVIHKEGRECSCGNLGCLESYIGINGIVRTAKEKLEFSSGGSTLHDILPSNLTPLEIFNAARKEDPVALEVVDSFCHDLGLALSSLINLLDIQNIFLYGGIANSGNILKRKTEKHLKSYVLPNLKNKVSLKISTLNQTGGGVLGAAAAIKEKMSEVISD